MSQVRTSFITLAIAVNAFLSSGAFAQGPILDVQPPDTSTTRTAVTDPVLSDENLLLFEINLDRISVTDALPTYASPNGPLIPVGELSRLLDVDLSVTAGTGRITGTVGEARRPVLVDVATRTVRVAGQSYDIAPGDVAVGLSDIFVTPALLQRILPVEITVEPAALRIIMKALEQLPIQARLDRLGRLRELQPDLDENRSEVLRVRAPHRLFTLPSLDVALDMALDSDAPKFPRRFDIRAGGDLLFTGFQGFVGSDDTGVPSTARLLFERRDPQGMFGGLNITRMSAGDVFTPALTMGARSAGGRGFSLTTAPLEQTTVFQRVDLRGELPLGFDVELYVNDVLRSGQETPVQGRYEFRDVPLVRGINVIRVVSYGPRGERSEEVRVISVGGGQLAKGKAIVDFGIVQESKALVDIQRADPLNVGSSGTGELRITTSLAYGLTEGLTVTGGAASYTPGLDGVRRLGVAGLRTSLFGLATQLDVAVDDKGGYGAGLGLAGRPFGISTIYRHSEYRGGFIDETTPRGGDGRALKRFDEITFDIALKPFGKVAIPLSLRAERDEFSDGSKELTGTARVSSSIGSLMLSGGLDFARSTAATGESNDRLTGVVTGSTFALFKTQIRAALDYDVLPDLKLRGLGITADRPIGDTIAARLGYGQSFGMDKESTVQAGLNFKLPFGDLALTADYARPSNDWRVALQFAFSLVPDPLHGSYVVRRSGAASGGNLALQAFVDGNGNGIFDSDEAPVPGLSIDGAATKMLTDEDGQVLVTGLGYAATARVQTNLDEVDLPYVTSPPSIIEFTPRAGRVVTVYYPLRPQGEVLARLLFRQPGGKLVGLSAVRLRAMRAEGGMMELSTEYDGSVVFGNLQAGSYTLELDPEQAARLKMRLSEPLAFVVKPEGGVLPDIKGMIEFDRATP